MRIQCELAAGARQLVDACVDEVLLGLVEPDGIVHLFRAGPSTMLNGVEILGHADLIRAGFASEGMLGFSLLVSNGRVSALIRNSMLNQAMPNMNLPSELVDAVLIGLGNPEAEIYGH